MPRQKKTPKGNGISVNLGFEETLWAVADKHRNNMDAAGYTHGVLPTIREVAEHV